VPQDRQFREYDLTCCSFILIMNYQPPAPAARHLSVSRVWPCSSCGYLAKSDIFSAVCPNCGHIGIEGSNVDSKSSPGGLQTETQGIASDSSLSETAHQDAKTSVTRSPDSSTLFIPTTEDSSDVWLRIRSHLGTDLSVIFGEFPVGILLVSKFYANQPTGRFVWEHCCWISYQGSSAYYGG
jgi:hypothetical protein